MLPLKSEPASRSRPVPCRSQEGQSIQVRPVHTHSRSLWDRSVDCRAGAPRRFSASGQHCCWYRSDHRATRKPVPNCVLWAVARTRHRSDRRCILEGSIGRTDILSPGIVPLVGGDLSALIGFLDTLTPGIVPIIGQDLSVSLTRRVGIESFDLKPGASRYVQVVGQKRLELIGTARGPVIIGGQR
jgi:hypothetical protein